MEKSSEGNLPQEFHEKSTVAANRFALNSFMLRFRDDSVESAYREHITEGTLWYCRIAWFLTFLLVCLFGLLDQQLYKDAVGPVQLARTLLITSADTRLSVKRIRDQMREHLPGLSFVETPEGGHMAIVSKPDLVNPDIIRFLDQI